MLHNFTHRLVISSLIRDYGSPYCQMFTSLGVRPGDHHKVFHNVSQYTNIHTKVSLLQKPHPIKAPLLCCGEEYTLYLCPGSLILSLYLEHPQNWKNIMHSTKPTYISSVLCAVIMVICSMNRSLGSQIGTTTTNSTKQAHVHSRTIILLLLFGSPRFPYCYQNINHFPRLLGS
jgi:hypothetical protein